MLAMRIISSTGMAGRLIYLPRRRYCGCINDEIIIVRYECAMEAPILITEIAQGINHHPQ